MLVRKEQEDKAHIEAIGALSVNVLRDLLMPWVAANMPDLWTLLEIDILVPTQCSDGVSRALPEYILFCTGYEFPDHVSALQQKLSGIVVGFQNLGSKIRIVVSKAALP